MKKGKERMMPNKGGQGTVSGPYAGSNKPAEILKEGTDLRTKK